jgi:ATP-binding protein involved in chromosome partitioning
MNSQSITSEAVENLVGQFQDPETGRKIAATNQLYSIDVNENRISVTVGMTSHCEPIRTDVQAAWEEKLKTAFPNAASIQLLIERHQRKPLAVGQIGLRCKSVIAVGSGKGGVGKSTVAASLALALKNSGCAVGLMDADVYGPSIPHLLGLEGQPSKVDEKIQPIDFDGMPVMSIGFMVPVEQAVIWRGPMLHSAVTQFLRDTNWGELDYLIIDMPPGTGDVALSLSQLLPLTGAVVVCTPQQVALLDAIKAAAMFDRVKIPLLGVVENMSSFVCPDCNKQYDIFGKGGARKFAEQLKAPFLGEIPIYIQMRERGDHGQTMANFQDPQIAPFLEKIAYQLVRHLSERAAANPIKPQLPVLS